MLAGGVALPGPHGTPPLGAQEQAGGSGARAPGSAALRRGRRQVARVPLRQPRCVPARGRVSRPWQCKLGARTVSSWLLVLRTVTRVSPPPARQRLSGALLLPFPASYPTALEVLGVRVYAQLGVHGQLSTSHKRCRGVSAVRGKRS